MPTIDMARTGQHRFGGSILRIAAARARRSRILPLRGPAIKKEMRIAHHMTIDEICDACGGISKNAVCKWQRGDSIPSIDNFVILSALWDTPIDLIIARR